MSRASILLCAFLGPVALLATVLDGSPIQGQEKVSIDTIAKVWKERQEQVRSVRVVWSQKVTLRKGQITHQLRSMPRSQEKIKSLKIPPGSELPTTEVVHNIPCLLVLDGKKMRYERENQEWSPEKQTFVPWARLAVFDGQVGKRFYPIVNPSSPWPQGEILSSNPETRPVDLIPLAVTFRPFELQLCANQISSMNLTGRRTEIKGHSCLELEQPGRSVRRLWVDPKRDYVVLRITDLTNERPLGSVDIEYRHEPKGGWVPHAWRITDVDQKGMLKHSSQATVTSYEFNSSISPEEFDVQFPPGTIVRDLRDRSSYLVKEGGQKRTIQSDEWNVPYETLRSSEPGEASGNRLWSFFSWEVGLGLGVLLVAGGLLIWRIRAVRKQPA